MSNSEWSVIFQNYNIISCLPEGNVIDSVDDVNQNVQLCSTLNSSPASNMATTGSNNIDFGRKYLSFSPHHIQCLCEALQQRGDVEKLATFLWNLPTNEMFRLNESVLRYAMKKSWKSFTTIRRSEHSLITINQFQLCLFRARAIVAYHRGLYHDLYQLLENHSFAPKFHTELQLLWFKAHYKEAEKVRGRTLGNQYLSYSIYTYIYNIVPTQTCLIELWFSSRCAILVHRSRWQISFAQEVSAAENDMGWWGNGLLFQREESQCTERLLQTQSISNAWGKEIVGEKNWTHSDPSIELVQKSKATRSNTTKSTVSMAWQNCSHCCIINESS